MEYNELSGRIIGAAIEVHRELGPGLLESVDEEALCFELNQQEISFQRQERVPILYKGTRLATDLRLDLIVEEAIIVEGKAKKIVTGLDRSQLLTYLRLKNLHLGLLINFNVPVLKDGIHRVVNGLPE